MESGLNGLDVKQAEYLHNLVDRDFTRHAQEALMLAEELGPESPSLDRTMKKIEFIESVGKVLEERVRYLRQVEEVKRRSAQLQAVANG